MKSTITVRDIDPGDKAWLRREARNVGVSMEEFVRRLIREKRVDCKHRANPSEAFVRYFGPEHGVDLPRRQRFGYRPISFVGDNGT